jgi:glycosyltransferase 2 family protein
MKNIMSFRKRLMLSTQVRQRLLILVGLLISAVFLWIAFSGLNPSAVWESIQTVQIGWLLVGVGVFFISMILIAWRWGFLLRDKHGQSLPLAYLTELVAMTYMGNNVYPLRAGEFLRVFLLQRDHQIPIARSTTTIFIERIFDGFVMLAFVVIPLRFIDIASPELARAVEVATPLFAGGLVVFLVFALNPHWIRTLAEFTARLLPRKLAAIVIKVSEDVIMGMEALRSPRNLLGALIGSVATWLFNAAVYWVVGFAFGINVGYPVMLLITGAVNLAGVLPASPGQIGVFEFFVSTILRAVGIAEPLAIAYAIVVHVVIWLPPTLLGFVLLARRGLGLQSLSQRQQLAKGTSH